MSENSRYIELSDEELVMLLREGDKEVADYICDKYKNLVRSKAKSMYILGAEPEDLIQEGMIGLFKAMRDYDAGRDASFATFAGLCISRQLYKSIQASNRQKHMPLNSYVSLYSTDSEESGTSIGELLASATLGPEDAIIDRENVEFLEKQIEASLSEFERQVLDLHLTGMGYTDIAKVLGRDEKSADNALQRLKSKIKKIVNG